MGIDNFGTGITIGVAIVLLIGFALVFSRLYTRASKEQSFVRTGFGGEKVIMDGGALVFPILHEVIPVNMNTLRLEVARRESSSLITKDKMRVDVTAEFYVRVGKTAEAISFAAQTLGRKTLKPEELKSLVEGKFVDALRSTASGMTMMELHEKRPEFVSAVQQAVQNDLEKNGLELESVSLTGLDQTDRRYFNEDNAFDAEGLTQLTEQIETRKKQRNDIEQTNRVAIEAKRIEAEKETLLIQRDGEMARIGQQKELDEQRARTDAEVAKTRAEQQKISEEADIERERAIEEARIQKQQKVEIAGQDKSIAVAEKSKAEAAAKAEADKARGEQVKAEEQVLTIREQAKAERAKSIAITKAQEEAEKGAVEIRVSAEAEKSAAIDRAEALKISTAAEAERETLLAEAKKATALAEAEGLQAKNAAENSLSGEAMNLRRGLALISELKEIIEASTKPMEKIDSIRIVDLGKALGGQASAGGAAQGGAEGVVNAALNYRAQAPLVDNLLAELGIAGGLSKLVTNGAPLLDVSAPAAKPQAVETVAEAAE